MPSLLSLDSLRCISTHALLMKVAAFLPLLLSVATLSRASEAALPLSPLVDSPDLYQDQLTRDTEVLYAAGYLEDRLEKRDTNAELYGAQTSPPGPVFRYGVGSTKVRGVSALVFAALRGRS